MPITAQFPLDGDELAAMAWHNLRLQYLSLGHGADSGFGITRNSATSVTVATGYITSSLLKVLVPKATLSAIPAAGTGKQRYDMVVVDLSDNTIKRIQGVEATPTGRHGRTPANDFLENFTPIPATLTQLQFPLYCLRITASGLVDSAFGDYATHGIAPIYIGSPLNIDSDSLSLVSGKLSTNIYVTPAVTITRAGGASQAIVTSPAICEIEKVVVLCETASPSGTMSLGWSGSESILMTDSEVPKTLNAVKVIRLPTDEITSAKAIIATVGGSGNGQWKVWLVIARFA